MGHRPSCVPVVLRYYDITAFNNNQHNYAGPSDACNSRICAPSSCSGAARGQQSGGFNPREERLPEPRL
eukprot:6988579-Prymnesium_polylepis.1